MLCVVCVVVVCGNVSIIVNLFVLGNVNLMCLLCVFIIFCMIVSLSLDFVCCLLLFGVICMNGCNVVF